jgi:glycerophosphoryl diester phosphodiesterase
VAIAGQLVTSELIEAAHAENICLFGWGLRDDPLNQATELCHLINLGVDFVTSGYPDLLRQVVENCTKPL